VPIQRTQGRDLIIPYRDTSGKRNGFLAGEIVYNNSGRRLGHLVGDRVFDPKGEVVANIQGDQLTLVTPLSWFARTIDACRNGLRHVGLMRLDKLPD